MTRDRLLILTADDYGLTPGVNRGIERAHAAGGLTATTVLVTGAAAGEAGELPRRCPELDVGLHVNLTLGAPAADPSRIRSLVDADGHLLPARRLMALAVRRRVRAAEIRHEVEAQIARLRALGVEPTHWDAHQQAAFWPALLGPAAAATRGAGLRRARTPRVLPLVPGRRARAARWRWRLDRPVRLLTDAHRALAAARLRRRFALPAWQLAPALVMGAGSLSERWDHLLAMVPTGVSEAVSHPAVVDDELRRLSPGLADERGIDLAVLGDPSLAARLAERGITVVGFRALPA